jgi:hypothetical protein
MLMGMMGGKGGNQNMGNLFNMMNMMGGMNGTGGGGNTGGMDMNMMYNMIRGFQNNNQSRPAEETPRQREEREQYSPRQSDAPPDYKPEPPPEKTPPPRDDEPPRRRPVVSRFYEYNNIRNYEPLSFDAPREKERRGQQQTPAGDAGAPFQKGAGSPPRESGQNGHYSRPIKNIAGEDIPRKIDKYFNK